MILTPVQQGAANALKLSLSTSEGVILDELLESVYVTGQCDQAKSALSSVESVRDRVVEIMARATGSVA